MTTVAVPRRAMVLAAGEGQRLRPYTESVPKCMMIVDGRPVLEHVLRHLVRYGVEDVVINLHHLAHTVVAYFGDGSAFGVRIKWSVERVLLGTAGGVAFVRHEFSEKFLVWYGDNMSDIHLDRLVDLHAELDADVTIALFHRDYVGSSGIVDVDATGRVHRFLEKPGPEEAFSNWVSGGIYVLEPRVLDGLSTDSTQDFGRDVFPALLASGRCVAGYRMGVDEQLRWIDTPNDLARVNSTEPGQL